MKIEESVKKVYESGYKIAFKKKHEYFLPEHFLYACLQYREGIELIKNCGGEIKFIKNECENFFKKNVIPIIENKEPVESNDMESIFNDSIIHAISSQSDMITLGDVLLLMIELEESYAAYFLKKSGVTKLSILEYISHQITSDDAKKTETIENEINKFKFLSLYTTDITEKAVQNKLEPVIGREKILEKTILVLSRRTKNNPVHVGEPGVGKTSITEGLAQLIAKNKVPDKLKNAKIFSLDIAALIAGTKFRGDFENRLKGIINDLLKIKNSILFIDEIHNLVGMGSISGGSLDASNILKPILVNSDLRCIGATTYNDYKKYFEKDHALVRRFQKIDIPEPTIDETVKILKGLKQKYEEFHNVKYKNEVFFTATELSFKYITDKFLPDKAIDVIDEAGALLNVREAKNRTVRNKDIETVVSKIVHIPKKNISTDEIDKIQNLEKNLKNCIFGQNNAIEKLVDVIEYSNADLTDTPKPMGVFLFAGPTGVGKTELSKQLANNLKIKLLRFDMSEYQEKHTVSRLIGAPPGYVGYEQGGLLTEEIRKNPYAVLLFDEIEKAHSDIFNALLQIMDYATLTDSSGRKADFKNVIIIMTSNAGVREFSRNSVGFKQNDSKDDILNKAIKKVFSPEFINRLDEIIQFKNLSISISKKIVNKCFENFSKVLNKKNIKISYDKKVVDLISYKGYSEEYGARNIERTFFKYIKKKFVNEILFGRLKHGGTVKIKSLNDMVELEFVEKNEF